jgi:hypothetical protein
VTHNRSVSLVIALVFLIVIMSAAAGYAGGSETGVREVNDRALGEIVAEGISVGGSLTNSCSQGSNAICVGTFEFTDDHQFDNSNYKGAIDMSGNVQQYVSGNINVNQTQGAAATGVDILDTPSVNNSTVTLNNLNNATSFVGGF